MSNNILKFEDILSWKKAQDLSLDIYKLFRNNKDFSFRDQICRASLSISNNIAEGFERNSKKQFCLFLNIAKGSCAEVRSMLYLAKNLDYINEREFDTFYRQTEEIAKLIFGLNRALNN